jgi:homocysteine S-methyltransferase
MAHALARGKLVVLVELWPPKGHEATRTLESARTLKISGVDAINIPDGPIGPARMSALSLAVLIEQQAGIETVLHYACRDRTLLGMQSDLLGAHAMGIRNVLLVTGDPPKPGDYPRATSAFDVDSIGLTNVVSRLNQGVDIGGQPIGRPSSFHIGVAVNPTALDPDEELRRFDYKVEAGAEFAVTQVVFDLDAFDRFMRRSEHARLPVIAGVWPFENASNAEFMANEVPGARVPDVLMERMRRADPLGGAPAEGIAIARDIARALKGRAQGLHISTASGNVDSAILVLDGLR